MADLTLLLDALHRGEPDAAGALLAQVYAELRALARAKMSREQPGHTLQPTALVHEAWLRLGDQRFENRAHFFGAAAEAMQRILVERARSKSRDKRGAGAEHVDVDEIEIAAPAANADELLRVHEVLERFAAEDPQKAELVKLRFFAGLTLDEAAGTRSDIYSLGVLLYELLTGHKAGVLNCIFSPDGRTLITGSDDRTMKFWNLAALREVASIPLTHAASCFAFSPDGQTLTTNSDDGSLRCWRAPSLTEIDAAEAMAEKKP